VQCTTTMVALQHFYLAFSLITITREVLGLAKFMLLVFFLRNR